MTVMLRHTVRKELAKSKSGRSAHRKTGDVRVTHTQRVKHGGHILGALPHAVGRRVMRLAAIAVTSCIDEDHLAPGLDKPVDISAIAPALPGIRESMKHDERRTAPGRFISNGQTVR